MADAPSIDILSVGAGSLATLLTAFGAWFGIFRKSSTDEASIALEAWKELVSPMQSQIAEMKAQENLLSDRIKDLERENQELKRRIKELEENK